MKKYRQIFKISLMEEFAYRFNFLLWRLRNVIQILILFYFWNSVFSGQTNELFGYDRSRILTYVFGTLILRAIILSSRAVDAAGEIAGGDLTNMLLKPFNYFKYWFLRDASSKSLNLVCSAIEISVLFVCFRPQFYFQKDLRFWALFLIALALAVLLFFLILFLVNAVSFWMPENAWAAQFLFIGIILEFLAGGLFPLDILPPTALRIISFSPFYYLLFFPLQVYLGKVSFFSAFKGIILALIWLGLLFLGLKKVWHSGLKVYGAEGR